MLFQALCPVFALDDYRYCEGPLKIEEPDAYWMQYGKSLQSRIWAVSWIPTNKMWTVVKTSPFELLCEYAKNCMRPRLAEIAMLLECPALQVNLYDSTTVHTVEACAAGNCCITGATFDDMDRYNHVEIDQPYRKSETRPKGFLYDGYSPFILNPQFNKGLENAYPGLDEDTVEFGEALTGLKSHGCS